MARPHTDMSGIGGDDFVATLRHLSDFAASATKAIHGKVGGGNAGAKAAGGAAGEKQQPYPLVGSGRHWLFVARLACAVATVQQFFSALCVLFCLWGLRLCLRLVMLVRVLPLSRYCSCTRAKPGSVNTLTACHWALTNMIIQLGGLRRERNTRHRMVQKFLSRHPISSSMSIRVRRHADRSQPQQGRDASADHFRRLSTDLMVDLLEEMRVPVLSIHPFFATLRATHPHLVGELCHEALLPMLRSPNHFVFGTGDACSHMYIIISGHVQYSANVQRDAALGGAVQQVRRTLHGGQWLSEAALWTGWIHRGETRVITETLLFALDATQFAKVISSHKSAHAFAAAYARKFVEGLNRGLQTDLVDAGPVDQ